ncbi:MAG: rRNA pseudouridine synthase [Ignavibacteria bacterium]|nr:rRNA pseudouridine synthase [Ignavibacteria bacterium]
MAKKKETSKETSNDIVKDTSEEAIDNTVEEAPDYTAYKSTEDLTEPAPAKERLNKFIAANGMFSRRKIDEFIVEGRVSVNGKEVYDLGTKINPLTDKVFIDGERVRITDKKIYLMMNKPLNVITSVSDEKKRPTVIDIVNMKIKVFPVGRLDFHTTGLLILTNDGDFANKLMNPVFKVWKTYDVKLSRPLEQKHRQLLEKGIKLEGVYTLPSVINLPNERDYTEVVVSISQGKNRQVRRMFEHFGYFVNKLHRSGYGALKLGNLREGEFRKMTKEEVDSLMTKQPSPKSTSEERIPRERTEKSEVKGVKKNYTRGPKDFKKDKPVRDFKKKFTKDKDEPRKDFTKNFSDEKPSRFSRETDSQRGFKKKFSDDTHRENKIDYKKKFSNDTRSDKRPKRGYEDDFSDRPKSSVRDDDFIRKDSKPGFKKNFSKSGPKRFSSDAPKSFSKSSPKKYSADSKRRDSKPDFKKKFLKKASSGSKNFKSGFKKRF